MFRAVFRVSFVLAAFLSAAARAESVSSDDYRKHLSELVAHSGDLSGTHGKSREECSLELVTDPMERWYDLVILGRRGRVLASARIPSEGAFEQTLEQAEGYRTEATVLPENGYDRVTIRVTTFDDLASFDLSITELDGHYVQCQLSE